MQNEITARGKVDDLKRELDVTEGVWAEDDNSAASRWNEANMMWQAAFVAVERGRWELAEQLAKEGLAILEGD